MLDGEAGVVAVAERMGGNEEDVWCDDFIEQSLEFAIRQLDTVERFELLAEVLLQCGAVPDVQG